MKFHAIVGSSVSEIRDTKIISQSKKTFSASITLEGGDLEIKEKKGTKLVVLNHLTAIVFFEDIKEYEDYKKVFEESKKINSYIQNVPLWWTRLSLKQIKGIRALILQENV